MWAAQAECLSYARGDCPSTICAIADFFRVLAQVFASAPRLYLRRDSHYLFAGSGETREASLLAPVAAAPILRSPGRRVESHFLPPRRGANALPSAGYLPYLLLQSASDRSKTRFTLIARGLDAAGRLRHLAFDRDAKPGPATWDDFLARLEGEWPAGRYPRLVVADHSPGLEAAIIRLWPAAHLQLCWSQELRQLLEHLDSGDEAPCLAGAWGIAEADSHADAVRLYAAWARRWRDRCPAAVALIQRDLPLLLAFLAEPDDVRCALRAADVAFGGSGQENQQILRNERKFSSPALV